MYERVTTTRARVIGPLFVSVIVLIGGCAVARADLTVPHGTAAASTDAPDHASARRALDAMGGSGSAGMDPAAATAMTAQEQADLAGDIIFSVQSCTFQGQVSVQLSTSIEDAQIRYTTNGAAPTTASTLYSAALVFTSTTQLRAQAYTGGTPIGAPGTALYIARSFNATHDLPLMVLDAYGAGKPGREFRDVAVMVMDRQANATATLAQTPTIATRAGFHVRGQSSASFAKTPYRLELRDNLNEDADYPVLGMPADSDWALRGPYPDKTLIRDAFAYGVGRDMGLQAPRFAFVELYLNLDSQPMASNDYQGVYMLLETIKRSSDRVNIKKLKDTDITEPAVSGGYILQFNMMATEPPTLTCTGGTQQAPCWTDLEVVEPDPLQPQQRTWITSYIQRFHNALHSANASNPQTGYPAYIDVDSFVNRIIHNELAREADAYIRSTHFYKDRGGKLFAGPLWDYDIGYNATIMMGMPGMPGTSAVQGWQYQPGFGTTGTTDWFQKLMQDATFLAQVKTRWRTLRQGILSDAQMSERMTALSTPLTNAAQRNFQRWPILGTSMVGMFQTQTSQTWAQQLQIMRTFLTQRAAWLDSTSGWGGGIIPPSSTSPPPGGRTCTANYVVTNQWASGFQSDITVTAGASAISGWTVSWTFTNGQTVSGTWNAIFTSSGSSVTARNESYNGSLAARASTSFGFTGVWSGANSVPAVTCKAS